MSEPHAVKLLLLICWRLGEEERFTFVAEHQPTYVCLPPPILHHPRLEITTMDHMFFLEFFASYVKNGSYTSDYLPLFCPFIVVIIVHQGAHCLSAAWGALMRWQAADEQQNLDIVMDVQ